MPATNIVPFPTRRRDPRYHARPHRWTVRLHRPRPASQIPLPLPAESDLDARILAAKATASNYEDLAAKTERPVTRVLLDGLAARWNGRVLALIAERDARVAQGELTLPANGTTGRTLP